MISRNFIAIFTIIVAVLAIDLTYQDVLSMRALRLQQRIRFPTARSTVTFSRPNTTNINTTRMATPNNTEDQTTTKNTQPQSSQPPSSETPLPLPPPPSAEEAIKLDMSTGEATVKVDALGPLVVNQDGTLSRIDNWGQMTELERSNTLRVLGKRNQVRLEGLKAKEGEDGERRA